MLLQTVEVTVLEGREAEFEAALVEVRQRVFSSPGFRGFDVAQGAGRPSAYLVQVRWETAEELTAVLDSGRLDRAWAPAEPFLSAPLRASVFVERPNLGDQGPGVVTDLAWLRE
jgi:heme-degrading monooxygenase HmoA